MPPASPAPGTAVAEFKSFVPAPIIPRNVAELMQLADILFKGGMCPKACGRPESVAAIIAFGLEIGIKPAAAVNSIHLTNGKATLWGDIPLGLVQASGLLENHKEWYSGDGEERTAHCLLHRKGDPDGAKEFTYTIGQARKMGLFMKGGKEGPWDKDSDWMLKIRCRGRGMREKFADVLNGLHIGETDDFDPPAAAGQATQVEVRPQAEPSADGQPRVPATDVHGEVMIGDEQLREITRLMPMWVKIYGPNPGTPAEGIAAWKAMVGTSYGVDSAKRLTESQAGELLAKLRECESNPTAAVFSPSPEAGTATAAQQQPQPATTAA